MRETYATEQSGFLRRSYVSPVPGLSPAHRIEWNART